MPRRRWPWILAAIAVVIVVAIVIANLVGGGTTAAPPSTAIPAATSTEDPNYVEPTGCLGGEGRDLAMLTAAQKAAAHNSYGAVDFVASVVRWTYRYPTATGQEADAAEAELIATSTNFTESLRESMKSYQDPLVLPGTPYYFSTLPGVWYIEEAATDRYTVTIGSAYVIDGEITKYRASATFTVVWEDGAWRVEGAQQLRTTEDLFAIGTPFTGGC